MNISQDSRSVWRAGVIALGALLAYVVIVAAIGAIANPVIGADLLAPVGIVMALIPSALWLTFFYAQDHAEPEPHAYVLGVAALGALLAAAVGQPLITGVFRTSNWIGRDTLTEILGSILVVGFTQEFLKYAAVRATVFHSAEFNHRVDGVIYGAAAGIGYATVLNITTMMSSGGINGTELTAGAVRMVVTALAQGALGGLVGYFIGAAKFADEPVWWMPAGVALAATINGLFSWVSGEITRSPLSVDAAGLGSGGYTPWPALALSAAIAVALFALIFLLIRRANQLTLAGADADQR